MIKSAPKRKPLIVSAKALLPYRAFAYLFYHGLLPYLSLSTHRFFRVKIMHPFRQFIGNYTSISDDDWRRIEPCLDPQTLAKGEMLLEQGRICRHLYFLESGLLRFFTVKDGIDVTKFFTDAPYTFTSQQSFTRQTPAKESIEALENSRLWMMTFENADRLLENTAWNTFIRKLIQEVQTYTEEILEELQTQTAENRYKMMLENNAELLQRVPLKCLASYLGIAPESLSRIRKNMATRRQT